MSIPNIAPDQSYHDETVGEADALQIQERYGRERAKRLRPEGISQYIDLSLSEKFKHYEQDPWLDPARPYSNASRRFGASNCKVLILGAGYGGLLYAVRMIQHGIKASDILLVDSAGGFGGTWYWNRYPGLMCDIESYIYMPLLEEMGYMPKHKYAYGPELRDYADRIAEKWKIQDRGVFQTLVKEVRWEEESKEWVASMQEIRRGEKPLDFQIRSLFLVSASGVLNYPQLPDLPGIGEFQGRSFHTSRWDYACTGGSPTDPALVNLNDKNVAILGTGATAVQAVPHLAKWSKNLYVFQRTPSAVHVRGQRATDPTWWAAMTSDKGWQRKRNANFNARLTNAANPQDTDAVADGWSALNTYCALIGSPKGELKPQGIAAYVGTLHAQDLKHTSRVRRRVDEIVTDKAVASKLKAWYPSWCKRPCFHDDYLPSFNRPNVHLVDTDGQGIDGLTPHGILAQGKEYPIDVLIFSTGYRSPAAGNVASRANVSLHGRNGITLDERWAAEGISTLHGIVSRNFPNLFFPGPRQAAATANQLFNLDQLALHTAHVITQAMKNAGAERVVVEPEAEAEKAWAMEIMMRAAPLAGIAGCTPSYFNLEGETDRETSPEEQVKAAKGAIWGLGMENWLEVVGAWREKGDLKGLEVTVV